MRALRRTAAAALALGAAASVAGAAAPGRALTAEEEAGRTIYLTGESPSGASLTARVGDAILPASAVACASCHGRDGRGRPEGGAAPSDLTWRSLTAAVTRDPVSGRRRPAYDERTLIRAITEGLDAGGNRLSTAMPRYGMPRADLLRLVAYLRRLEEQEDPGVHPDRVRLAAPLPTRGRLAATGLGMQRVLEASFAELNARGGLHGRRLELEVAGFDPDRESGVAALAALAGKGDVFAVVSGLVPGEEKALADLAERERLPVVGPLTPFTVEGELPNAHLFYVLAGVPEQARALAEWAGRSLPLAGAPAAVVHLPVPSLEPAAAAAAEQLRLRGAARVEVLPLPQGGAAPVAQAVRAARARVVILLGDDAALGGLAEALAAAGAIPDLLVPATLATRAALDAPPAFAGKIHLGYPTLPSDARPEAAALVSRIAEAQDLAGAQRPALVSAHAAAAVLAEALRRTGRTLTRERLVTALEGLAGFEPGLVPPVRYGPRRRVGAAGAHVVSVDPVARTFRPAGPFVAVP